MVFLKYLLKFNLKTAFLLVLVFPFILFAEVTTKMTDSGYMIDISIENLDIDTVYINNTSFLSINASNIYFSGNEGEPAIPMIGFSTAAPENTKLNIELLELESRTISGLALKPITIIPPIGSKTEEPISINYTKPQYPDNHVITGKNDKIFGVPVISWEYSPVLYNVNNNQIKIITKAKIKITNPEIVKKRLPVNNNLTTKHYKFLKQRIHNYSYINLSPSAHKSLNAKTSNYDLSSGNWLKLKIDHEGIYKLTYSSAKDAGFPVDDISLENIILYGHHGQLLPANTSLTYNEGMVENPIKIIDNNNNNSWNSDDYIIFYGRGAHNFKYNSSGDYFNYTENYYDDYNYYYLSNAESVGARIASHPSLAVTPDSILTQTLQIFHYEKSKQNILESGLEWYDRRFSGTSGSFDLEFSLNQTPLSTTNARFEVGLKGGYGSFYSESSSTLNASYNFNVSVNSTQIFTTSFNNNNYRKPSTSIPAALLNTSNTFTISYSSSQSHAYAYFDYLNIQYYISNNLTGNFIKLYSPAETGDFQYNLTTSSDFDNLLLINVSDPFNPQEVGLETSDNGIRFIDNNSDAIPDEFILAKYSNLETPASVVSISTEDNLRDPGLSADLIIITSESFINEAEKLKSLKETSFPQYELLQTEIATTERIYREFSSGQLSPVAIRNFIKYSVNNWTTAPQYVIFLGDGHFDYKGIIYPNYNIVPPYEVDHNYENYSRAIEGFFTDTDFTGSYQPDLPLGRINVETTLEFENYYDKLQKYMESYLYSENYAGWQSNITLVADDQFADRDNEKMHIVSSEIIANTNISDIMNIKKIYLTDYEVAPGGIGRNKPGATKALIDQYNKGTSIINFFGHGSPTTWAHESLFNIDRDLPKLRNSYRNPIVLAATCSFGQFDKPGYTAACEELLTVSEVGAIGVIAGNRATTSGSNESLIKKFFTSLFNFEANTNISQSFGDAFLSVFSPNSSSNTQKYLLMADPTLKLCGGGYKINIDSISSDTLKALSKNHLSATILNPDNSTNTEFNGTAVLNVFDAYSDEIYPFYELDTSFTFKHPGKPVFKGQYSVVNGQIQGDFIIPKSIKYKNDPSGRISLYAFSEEKGSAVGYKDNILVYGSEQGINDSDGPSIDVSFIENPGFIDGDVISSNATIKIALEDSNGINITGESGHELMLIIDGQQTFNVTEFFLYHVDSYQKGVIEYPLTGLTNGQHSLSIKVWDNLNNLTIDETHFEVVASSGDSDEFALYHVVNVPNPMKDETKFTFSIVNNNDNYADVTIKIFTLVGRKIKKIETTITEAPNGYQEIYWDGRDDDGDHMANGVYIYKIILKNGDKKVSKIDKLMILK